MKDSTFCLSVSVSVCVCESILVIQTYILSSHRRQKLNGDHGLTQLAMSWIPVGSQEVGEDEDMVTKNKKK